MTTHGFANFIVAVGSAFVSWAIFRRNPEALLFSIGLTLILLAFLRAVWRPPQ